MGLTNKKLLTNAFFNAQLSYCPLIWMCHIRSNNSKVTVSSIVNEGITAILNLFIFFVREDFTRTKKHKKHTSEQKQKRQHFYANKKHLRRRKSLV